MVSKTTGNKTRLGAVWAPAGKIIQTQNDLTNHKKNNPIPERSQQMFLKPHCIHFAPPQQRWERARPKYPTSGFARPPSRHFCAQGSHLPLVDVQQFVYNILKIAPWFGFTRGFKTLLDVNVMIVRTEQKTHLNPNQNLLRNSMSYASHFRHWLHTCLPRRLCAPEIPVLVRHDYTFFFFGRRYCGNKLKQANTPRCWV